MHSKHVRGPLPLTPAAFHILLSLTDAPMHGYAVKKVVEERTEGVVQLGAGTLYHAIRSLDDRGFVAETDAPESEVAPNPRTRFYRITQEGRGILEAELRRLESDVSYARARLAATKAGRS